MQAFCLATVIAFASSADAETLNEQNERRAVNKKSFTSDLKNNFADSPHKQLTASEQN
jgi:hypothetical protein